MSLLDRLNLLIRSEFSDRTRGDRFRSALSDMEESLRDARRQQVQLRRDEKRLVAQIRQSREKADQWEERAMLALKHGDEDLAREALVVKNKALEEAERLRDQLDEHRDYLVDIEKALEALEMKLQGTKGRIESSRERGRPDRLRDESAWDREMRKRMEKRGESTDEVDRSGGDSARRFTASAEPEEAFETEDTFREFDRMSDKISAMEAEFEAIRELSDDDWADPRRRELEDIFSKMEDKKRTDDDLSDLKKKFSD